jgi:hypothetical protein
MASIEDEILRLRLRMTGNYGFIMPIANSLILQFTALLFVPAEITVSQRDDLL